MSSIQTSNLNNIVFLPLDQIRRPIVPVLDEAKIASMIKTLEDSSAKMTNPDLDDGLPPIDILRVRRDGQDYYFGFGGCHRFQAYERTGRKTVKAKVVPITEKMLGMYVGGSVDQMFKSR
ncbi:ParB/Sulfiredoxin [Lipomyces japonicus]|uniref:ParB/Sulfiredoxin n=1 Tax=Lipomyces japonicus TaxID=56871 RepID=UPI0034CF8130